MIRKLSIMIIDCVESEKVKIYLNGGAHVFIRGRIIITRRI